MTNNDQNDLQTNSKASELSLLERQSSGGDIGEKGTTFQADAVLSMIPKWLSMEGFTSMIREGMGDTEAQFFVPGRGYKKEFIEVKGKQLDPNDFWREIERFQQMDNGAKGEYQWFTLVTTGIHQNLHPLINSLRRIRDPYEFYEDSQIAKNSFDKYSERVRNLGKSDEDAEFLFNKVSIFDDYNFTHNNGSVLFKQSLSKHLPYYRELSDRIRDDIYSSVAIFVRDRRNQTINRNELEKVLRAPVPERISPPISPIHIHTAFNKIETDTDSTALRFEWTEFFGGDNRIYPPSDVWNQKLVGELIETKNWILEKRSTRRIFLTGNRRLSASLAIGSIFSAVADFSVDMQQREQIFPTDAHSGLETDDYQIQSQRLGNEKGERLIVSIGIKLNVVPEVDEYLQKQELYDLPRLHIKGDAAIISPEQANLVTGKIKSLILDNLAQSEAKKIDLFIASPAFLALFLGHRLNATAPVQCYERVTTGQYEPTCLLFGSK